MTAVATSQNSLPSQQDNAVSFVSVEFEVFGHVQGCYFPKYCKEIADSFGIGGWIKNTKKGTIVGKIQGEKAKVDELVNWLSHTGSPGCRIDRCELSKWEYLRRPDFKGFSIRF
ncbi:acylphosphatase-2-like [Artemia franciscana]|uniref:acylphosphatase-2-like n=1 Tax=Artemia franciscana TaxID=6661 RepID=UPI0032DB0181